MSSRINTSSFFILLTIALVSRGQDTTVVDDSCEQITWGDNQNYAGLVSDILDEVVFGVPVNPGFTDYSTMSSGDDVVYGFGECNKAISMSECYECMMAARDQLENTCGDAVGGIMELVDCEIIYENYDFYPM